MNTISKNFQHMLGLCITSPQERVKDESVGWVIKDHCQDIASLLINSNLPKDSQKYNDIKLKLCTEAYYIIDRLNCSCGLTQAIKELGMFDNYSHHHYRPELHFVPLEVALCIFDQSGYPWPFSNR
jgi:hypothetical protein